MDFLSPLWIASQTIGLLSVFATVWFLQIKDKSKMMFVSGTATSLTAVSAALLSNWVIVGLISVTAVRNFSFSFIEHRKKRGREIHRSIPFVLMCVFMIASVVSVSFTWNWWLDWVLLVFALVIIFGNWARGTHLIRLGIASYAAVTIVNYVIFYDYVGIVRASLAIGSVTLFYARQIRARKSVPLS